MVVDTMLRLLQQPCVVLCGSAGHPLNELEIKLMTH
jgi:hypothetical protein